jgi:hypothetical protein
VLAELSLNPLGRETRLSHDLAEILKIVDSSGLWYSLTPCLFHTSTGEPLAYKSVRHRVSSVCPGPQRGDRCRASNTFYFP